MSTRKEINILPKSDDYLGAAISVDGKYLLLRCKDEEVFNKYGYFFPGCKYNKDYNTEDYLKEQLLKKYGLKVQIDRFLGDTMSLEGNKKSCLYLFVCSSKNSLIVKNSNVNTILIDPKDFDKYPIDKADKVLLERISIFYKVYEGHFYNIKRDEQENKIIIKLYDSLLYFKDKIYKQDLLDFKSLIQTNASINEITLAYKYITSRANVSFSDYSKDKANEKK